MPSSSPTQCELCFTKESKYQCPQCRVNYCSLQCYRSDRHQLCLESFHKKNINEQIQFQDKINKSQTDLEKLKLITTIEKFQSESVNDGDGDWRYVPPVTANTEQLNVSKKDIETSLQQEEDDVETMDQTEIEDLINSVSTERLLGMLSQEQRERFAEMLRSQYADFDIID